MCLCWHCRHLYLFDYPSSAGKVHEEEPLLLENDALADDKDHVIHPLWKPFTFPDGLQFYFSDYYGKNTLVDKILVSKLILLFFLFVCVGQAALV